MSEKLCIFCTKFRWSKEEMWGSGSTMTGPMFEGGDACCEVGHGAEWGKPRDESDFRKIIVRATKCEDYDQAMP